MEGPPSFLRIVQQTTLPDAAARLSSLLAVGEAAAAAGDWDKAAAAAEEVLAFLGSPAADAGSAVRALALQAQAATTTHADRPDYAKALSALDLALQLRPGGAELLQQRAAAHTALGNHTAAFLDLRRASELHPALPGLQTALQQAAAAAQAHQAARRTHAAPPPRKTYIRASRRGPGTSATGAAGAAAGPQQHPQQQQQQQHYAVLGLQPGASLADVRAAYKRLALELHPDKLGGEGADAGQRGRAEERFKQVAAAYHALAGPAGVQL